MTWDRGSVDELRDALAVEALDAGYDLWVHDPSERDPCWYASDADGKAIFLCPNETGTRARADLEAIDEIDMDGVPEDFVIVRVVDDGPSSSGAGADRGSTA